MTDFSCAGFVVLTNFETDSKSRRAYSNKLSSVLTGPLSVVLIENHEQDDGDCLFKGCLQSAGKGIFDKYYEKRALVASMACQPRLGRDSGPGVCQAHSRWSLMFISDSF